MPHARRAGSAARRVRAATNRVNPSRHRLRNAYARVRYIDERADGQPLARLTPGFLPLIAMSVP